MNHKFLFLIAMVMECGVLFGQDVKKDAKNAETKMEAFASRTGVIVKFIDTKLPELKLLYVESAETRIRKVISGPEAKYFYQIEKQGKYGSNAASIEYSDLLEVIKAIKSLKADVDKDITLNPDYLENKFATTDGFQAGYYVTKGKATWYLKLEKYGSDNTVFIKEPEALETIFIAAKDKIEALKN